tara:strand:+ start:1448 stop:1657 length:210 start_codon:yes stop_codon:yes gene_type:complete
MKVELADEAQHSGSSSDYGISHTIKNDIVNIDVVKSSFSDVLQHPLTRQLSSRMLAASQSKLEFLRPAG